MAGKIDNLVLLRNLFEEFLRALQMVRIQVYERIVHNNHGAFVLVHNVQKRKADTDSDHVGIALALGMYAVKCTFFFPEEISW